MKICKIEQRYPDLPYIFASRTKHVVFETDAEEFTCLKELNENKNNGTILEFTIKEVDLETCSLSQISTGLSLRDFAKLVKYSELISLTDGLE